MKKISLYAVGLIALVFALGALTLGGSHPPVHATTVCPLGDSACLAGWAWSSTAGWISFNSNDGGGSNAYDVAVDSSGNLSGYAWSGTAASNDGKPTGLGWISFNAADLSAAPACNGTTGANVNFSTGAVTGWARVVSEKGRLNGSVSKDGWDGCIELSGTNHTTGNTAGTGGVTYIPASGNFVGYAWGSTVLGWLQFNPTLNPGNNAVNCSNCGGVTPSLQIQVQDAYSNWVPSTTITADSSGHATGRVQWVPSNLNGVTVQTASTAWPEGSGASTALYSSPANTAFNTPGSEYMTFTNTTNSTIEEDLTLAYGTGLNRITKTAIIYVAPYVAPIISCTAPAHALLCSGSDNSSGPATTVASCPDPSAGPVGKCQYTCDVANGYKLKNGICAKSTVQEF